MQEVRVGVLALHVGDVGFEVAGLPGDDDQLLRLGMAIEAVIEPLPPPLFRNG